MQGEEHRAAMGSIMQRAEGIRTAEIERAQKYLSELSPKQQQAVDAMSRAIVKKLLHPAMQQSRGWAEEGDLVRLDAALRALGVEPSDSESS